MRVAIYVRVSTTKQAEEGYSLDAQRKVLSDYCINRKYNIYKVYADEGISGKDMVHRLGLQALLDDAKQNLFDIVLVWKLTRFTRSLKDLITACEYLEKHNISLLSYSESFDTSTSYGRMTRNLLGVIAQWEREIISENIKIAIEEKVEQGFPVCARVLGYDNINKSLLINKTESLIVQSIYSNYIKLTNLTAVANFENKKGYRGKDGGLFTPQSVAVILTNPIYCGYNRYHGKLYKGNHKSIIPLETYNFVQRLIAGNRKGRIRQHPLDLIN